MAAVDADAEPASSLYELPPTQIAAESVSAPISTTSYGEAQPRSEARGEGGPSRATGVSFREYLERDPEMLSSSWKIVTTEVCVPSQAPLRTVIRALRTSYREQWGPTF
jgi:hypothetical protein